MHIRFLSIGKTRESWLQTGINQYDERIRRYCNFERIELPDIKSRTHLTTEQIKEHEGKMVLKWIEPNDVVVLLDERGLETSSEAFAAKLEQKMVRGVSSLLYISGGAYGFSPAVYARANALQALSQLTFSHQMVRLIFLEQLYRCFTIINREPYHHR